jgi:hypothetical protein
VPVAASETRQQLLDAIAVAADQLALALSALTEAYEHLDEASADRMEEALFRPVQAAYGRARRTHAGFAQRYGLPAREFSMPSAGAPVRGVKGLIERAVEAIESADSTLISLQDSLVPVEFGDRELRDGLAEVRTLLASSRGQARELLRTFGR